MLVILDTGLLIQTSTGLTSLDQWRGSNTDALITATMDSMFSASTKPPGATMVMTGWDADSSKGQGNDQ